MKRFLRACMAAVLMFSAMSVAQAAESVIGANPTGSVVYGMGAALSVEKNPGTPNRVKIRYTSGVQYATDSASWAVYARAVAQLGANAVAVPNSSTGLVYDISKSNGIYCQNGSSLIAWPNVGQPDALTGDGCSFWTAAKSVSQ